MTDAASGTGTTSDVLNKYRVTNQQAAAAATKKASNNQLGQTAFLELMITQMKNQDPLNPQSNSEFVAQLAQFSSVEGLEKLNTNFSNFSGSFMSNQALQASSLVGRSVSVESETSELQANGIVAGSFNLGSSTKDLKINIYNDAGALAATVPVGNVTAGDNNFRWDGHNMEFNGQLLEWSSSTQAPAGKYKFEVLATQDGKTQALTTNLSQNVNSVTIGSDGKLVLNLAGAGSVDMSKVKQIN